MDCWGHSLAKVIINKQATQATHDGRHKLRVIISSTFEEFETRENLRRGDIVLSFSEWFDHVNVSEIRLGFYV